MSKYFAARDNTVTQRELDNMALSRSLAGECVVLLENDGTLPLSGPCPAALFGSGARHTIRGGTGSGDVNTRSDVNVEQGMEKAGFTVLTKAWLDRQDEKQAAEKWAHARWISDTAREQGMPEFAVSFSHPFQVIAPAEIKPEDLTVSADTAVYVLSRTAGEGADRWNKPGDYLLYPEEKEQLALLGERFEKLILVLNVGGVMDMSEILSIPGINAVLLMGQLGNVGGDVLSDVLLGKVNPSGKLTNTWAKSYEDYPSSRSFSHNDGNVDDEYYEEGIFVGYRYFDTWNKEPAYPFGYGLSYTSFSVEKTLVEIKGEKAFVTASVKNTGARTGKEVVQVYFSAPGSELPKPKQELLTFVKTPLLSPGEQGTVTAEFSLRSMASYCESSAAWILEAGDYVLRIGTSSRSTRPAAVLRLEKTIKTEIVKNVFPDADPVREIRPPVTVSEILPDVPIIVIDPECIPVYTAAYTETRKEMTTDKTNKLTAEDIRAGRCTVEELAAQLTVEELAELCVGTQRQGEGSVVGVASHTVPGAAGDTSAVILAERGVDDLILADGPAGLRLQPVFKTDKEGNLLPGGSIMGEITQPFDPKYDDTNSDTWYQYCTAIPIGWSLAMSWNMPLLEKIGSMIGGEMEIFGVDLWLAPALNIHRNPLCGRNFEYYSEDPVISGQCAAALTRGVQSHPGRGTTIKHFAVNNQEDNRYFTNSHVSERALREIYLRGFRIAVEESQPLSIMTSYNLLNGTHTANHYGLLQSVARDEWGFRGFVMTDWFTSQNMPTLTGANKVIYPISASTGCVYAGNDVQMPGCQKNVDDLVKAVRTGESLDGYTVTLADLQFNAANLIRVAVTMAGEKNKP